MAIKKSSVPTHRPGEVMYREAPQIRPPDIRIVVLQRGWVLVGYYSQDGMDCFLHNAKCIRRWGTTTGLGQLKDGPLGETQLDLAGEVSFHRLTVVLDIKCNSLLQAWANILDVV